MAAHAEVYCLFGIFAKTGCSLRSKGYVSDTDWVAGQLHSRQCKWALPYWCVWHHASENRDNQLNEHGSPDNEAQDSLPVSSFACIANVQARAHSRVTVQAGVPDSDRLAHAV